MTDIAALIERHASAVETKMDATHRATNETKARLDELEQKLASFKPGSGNGDQPESWGREFVEQRDHELKQLASGNVGRVRMETKATITSASSGGIIVPQVDNTVLPARRRLTVRDLLTVVRVGSGVVEYPRLKPVTNVAAPVAEGALKPESSMEFELKSVPIRTIAHWLPASVQVLDDLPQLMSLIDVELRYGVALTEENQLLNGSGTGENLLGMVTQATAFAPPTNMPSGFIADAIGAAILQVSLTEHTPDGVIMHPTDWWRMRLAKDADGKYVMGEPSAYVTPVLFGLPVVVTTAMAAGKFLVGNFESQVLYDRMETRIDVAREHADFFTRNLVAVRGEERIGFAAKVPQALIYGTFA